MITPDAGGRAKSSIETPASGVYLTLSERDLQANVLDLAALFNWHVAHFRPALTRAGDWRTPVAADGKGFVDLVLVRDRVLFVELKSEKGKLSPEQSDWGARLLLANANYLVWRPADWFSGEIEGVLR